MLNLGLLAFTQPWLLAALAALPALWILLRITPPAPRRLSFPALRLLLRLEPREETPARTPLWLLLMRMALAALLILGLAGPVLHPAARLAGEGPLLLVVDDGWAAAPRWRERIASLDEILAQAGRQERSVMILRTAPPPTGAMAIARTSAGRAREALAGWHPEPWPVDRAAAARLLEDVPRGARVVWLTDRLAGSDQALEAARDLGRRLAQIGPVRVLADGPEALSPVLRQPDSSAASLTMKLDRPVLGPAATTEVRAVGPNGEILGQVQASFADGATDARATFDVPLELRNRIARLELSPSAGIGGTILLDERWRRRAVGLIGSRRNVAEEPLLSELFYIERALAPYAEERTGPIDGLLKTPLSMIVMPDIGKIDEADRRSLLGWIDRGGVLLRFAGPRLAASGTDELVPVTLRSGDRQLGGALSWSHPLPVGHFNPQGPFAGLEPASDAVVSRQVLAEPGPGLEAATFASLSDGTPLVTGRREGKGWLILVHTTANTAWTNLPLSGLFVDMLRRVLALASSAGGAPTGLYEADALLDADGHLRQAPPGLAAVPAGQLAELMPSPAHPAGLYAPARRLQRGEQERVARVAVNLQRALGTLHMLSTAELGVEPLPYVGTTETDLAPWLLLAALLILLLDILISYRFRGLLPALGRAGAAVILLAPVASHGADGTAAMAAANETRLAYVLTGVPDVDELSRAGLTGLTRVLQDRTSVEAADPVGVDLATDELAVYPLLYWPVPPQEPDLDATASQNVQRYIDNGGMILFDTKDAGTLLPGQEGGGPGERRLGQLLAGLDIPPLVRMPPDHVLTRSFYLMQDFPGRWTGQPVWVDQVPVSVNDGVSSVVIGANDWAGAWAADQYRRPLGRVVPGGEEQREMARRFGVNLVMYALTGNYKTDQVHVPALLERLGQ
jgi:hypothetical protein